MRASILILALAASACSKSTDAPETKTESATPSVTKSVAHKEAAPALPKDPAKASETAKHDDPTDPEELRIARNTAILEERMDDALRLCGKEDLKRVKEQGVMACVLTACRLKRGPQAKAWSALLGPKTKAQAAKACAGVDGFSP